MAMGKIYKSAHSANQSMVRNYRTNLRSYRKRTNRRNKSRNNSRSVIAKSIGNIGDRLFIPLQYNQQFNLSSTSGALAVYQVSGNSAFDPDYTSTGQQPEGYDQFASLFQYYRVHGSKIKVSFASVNTTAATQTVNIALVPRNDVSTESTMQNAMVAPFSRAYSGNISSLGNIMLRDSMKTTKIYGLPPKGLKYMDGWQASISTDPTNEWTWGIYLQSIDGSTSTTFIVNVEVIYYIEFYQRANLNVS